jgi:general secretion pathway protein A
MFLDFYKLREQPFGVTADPRFLYLSSNHREALASLLFAIDNGLGFNALLAEPGMGKTTLLFRILETLPASVRSAFLFATQCSPAGLLRQLLTEFDVRTDERDLTVLQERFEDVVVKATRSGRNLLIIIDEAQNLEPGVLETVRLLSNFETRRARLLHVILSGQPRLADRLARPDMAQLEQRLSMTNWLKPLTSDETARYIDHRLRVAGSVGAHLMSAEALEAIAAQSGGIPRKINRVCFNVMAFGCAVGEAYIDKQLVVEAGSDRGMRLLALQQTPQVQAVSQAGDRKIDSTPPHAETHPQSTSEQPVMNGQAVTPKSRLRDRFSWVRNGTEPL